MILTLVFALSSCKVIKSLSKKEDTQTQVNKVDSTGTQASGSTTKTDEKWERVTNIYDTNITRNYYHTNNIPIPHTVIIEKGEKQEDKTEWAMLQYLISRMDSLNNTKTEITQEKKTTVFTMGQLLMIIIGGVAVIATVIYLGIKQIKP